MNGRSLKLKLCVLFCSLACVGSANMQSATGLDDLMQIEEPVEHWDSFVKVKELIPSKTFSFYEKKVVSQALKPGCVLVEMTDSNCLALEGVDVAWAGDGSVEIGESRTDENGIAVVCDLSPKGDYTFTASAQGLTTHQRKVELPRRHGVYFQGIMGIAKYGRWTATVELMQEPRRRKKVQLYLSPEGCDSPVPKVGDFYVIRWDRYSCDNIDLGYISSCWKKVSEK